MSSRTIAVTVALSLSAPAGADDFRRAVNDGDLEAVTAAVAADPELLRGDALPRAAARGHLPVVRFLLERGADPDAWSDIADTSLHAAEDPEIVQELLKHRPDLSLRDAIGQTPLERAAREAADGGEHAGKWRRIVTLLREAGAAYTVNAAISLDDTDRVRELLALDPRSADGGGEGGVPLVDAAFLGRTEAVRLLLDRGVNPDTGQLSGSTWEDPYGWLRKDWPILVESVDHPEVVRLLIEAGADLESPVTWHSHPLGPYSAVDGGATALHYAAGAGAAESAGLLVAAGVPVDAADAAKQTPLHIAARYGRPATVRFLLDRGADPTARDAQGRTPLARAEEAARAKSRGVGGTPAEEAEVRGLLRRAMRPVEAEKP